jgi:hypothetical protein
MTALDKAKEIIAKKELELVKARKESEAHTRRLEEEKQRLQGYVDSTLNAFNGEYGIRREGNCLYDKDGHLLLTLEVKQRYHEAYNCPDNCYSHSAYTAYEVQGFRYNDTIITPYFVGITDKESLEDRVAEYMAEYIK